MTLNPLVFAPSIRNIERVMDSWNDLPCDIFVARYMKEPKAYQTGRDYFLEHEQYSHIVICPDDMVVDYDSFMAIYRAVDEYDFSNLAGVANLDETNFDVYACKPLEYDPESKTAGSYYTSDTLPENEIIEVGFTGFTCQFIERDLVELLSFTGGCNKGHGCMDLQFTRELQSLNIPQLLHTGTFFPHLRNTQQDQVHLFKNSEHDPSKESTYLIKNI